MRRRKTKVSEKRFKGNIWFKNWGKFRELSIKFTTDKNFLYVLQITHIFFFFFPELETELKTKDQQLAKTEAKLQEQNDENQALRKKKI